MCGGGGGGAVGGKQAKINTLTCALGHESTIVYCDCISVSVLFAVLLDISSLGRHFCPKNGGFYYYFFFHLWVAKGRVAMEQINNNNDA